MSKLAAMALCIVLLGSALSGCSLAGPPDVVFTPAQAPAKVEAASAADVDPRVRAKMQKDAEDCRRIARERSVRSLLAIAQSINPRNASEAYIACMNKKGYRAEGQPEKAVEETGGTDADVAPQPVSPD